MADLRYSPLRHSLLAAVRAGEVSWGLPAQGAAKCYRHGDEVVPPEAESTLEHLWLEQVVTRHLHANWLRSVELTGYGGCVLERWDEERGKVYG